jgi:transcriptional regulator with XRE-family HTH domain
MESAIEEKPRRAAQKLAQLIAEYRKTLGLSQERLARELDVSVRTIMRWEAGQGVHQKLLPRLRDHAEERGMGEYSKQFFTHRKKDDDKPEPKRSRDPHL